MEPNANHKLPFGIHSLSICNTMAQSPRDTWVLGSLLPQAHLLGISEQDCVACLISSYH